jgi:hypothetical protein
LLDSIVRDFRAGNELRPNRAIVHVEKSAALELSLVKKRNREWTDEDLNRLAAIVAAGGTPARASAALSRSIASCQIQACRRMRAQNTAQSRSLLVVRSRHRK